MQGAPFGRRSPALLAARVRGLYGLMEYATLRPGLRARVARRLLALARGDATQSPEPRVSVALPQEALAMMLGVTRQTLSKELNALARERVIALGYGRIDIELPALLERLGSAQVARCAGAKFACHLAAGTLIKTTAMTTIRAAGELIPWDVPGSLAMGIRQAAGVVLGMAPWNAPVILGVRADRPCRWPAATPWC